MVNYVNTVISNRRVNYGLNGFTLQSDNGEMKSERVNKFLQEKGGVLLTCCSYAPETQSKIERVWRTIQNMATAMLLEMKLPEPYWALAQRYACQIYNNIPPSRMIKGETPRSPAEKSDVCKLNANLFKVFGSRCFAHIDKSLRRKNHRAKALQCIFVGLDVGSVHGYLVYSPERNELFVSTHVMFHEGYGYDGKYTDEHAYDNVMNDVNIPVENVEKYKYLEGTNHIDPDDGLLYKIISVEEKNYPGQGNFIVGYRAFVFPNGKVSLKPSKDAYNIRDLEVYYQDYMKHIKPMVNKRHIDLAINDKRTGVASLRRINRKKKPVNTRKRISDVVSDSGLRKSPRLHTAATASSSTPDRPLLYETSKSSLNTPDNVMEDIDLESFLHDDSHVHKLVEHAMLGDALASYVLTNDFACTVLDPEPNTVKQALSLSDRKSWKEAIDAELAMIKDFNVFSEPMLLPSGAKVLNQRWVFKRKRDELGNILKYKARLTPQGCFQTFGIDFIDTYAPVARMTTVRFTLALSVLLSLRVSGIDFCNAFLNAPLTEDIYVNPPPGCPPLPQGYVYKLQRALYGLKQSPREWNHTLHKFLSEECHFRQLRTEHCLYIRIDEKNGSYCLICLYVDDLIVSYTHKSIFDAFLAKVKSKFKITHSDELTKTLGFQFDRTSDGSIFMHQSKYIDDVLKRFGMSTCRAVSTPSDYHVRLCKTGAYKVNRDKISTQRGSMKRGNGGNQESNDDIEFHKHHKPDASYREVIGCLLWVSMGTRPDITFAVNQCARYSSDPKIEHWIAVMRILRYLQGTRDYGLFYHKHSTHFHDAADLSQRAQTSNLKQPFAYSSAYFPGTSVVNLQGYSDADFANSIDDRRSITGYVFLFAGAPLSWNCMTQHTTALSTMESEYYAICKSVQEALYLRMLFEEVGLRVDTPLVIREDNQACIAFSKDPGEHKRTKHIDYRHFFVRDHVNDGEITLEPVTSENQLADIFTKSFEPKRFLFLRNHLVVSRATVLNVVPR